MTVEQALRKVEARAREPVDRDSLVSADKWLTDNRFGGLTLVDHQVDALEELTAALSADLRFEYMKDREIDEAARRFAQTAISQRDASHTRAFAGEYALEPQTLVCLFPVEGLAVHRELELFGVMFTPAEDAVLPGIMFGSDPSGT